MNPDGLDLFAQWARESGNLGLVSCSSGNLSHRIDNGSMLISGTGTWLPYLCNDQIAHMSIDSDESYNTVKPSGEFRLHREIYRKRKDIDTILHFQSPSATTVACMDLIPDYNVIIEVPVYIGRIGHINYISPGSEELADKASEVMMEADLLQLANHGQVVCGTGFRDTIQKAVFFELACSILLKSNFNAKPLSLENIKQLNQYLNEK
ncbi:MAG: class II aldolase/adducin family protein [Bacteroidales bacterium]|nr:class II aldolase/adducin family protein [Bacteroidales bacterium]